MVNFFSYQPIPESSPRYLQPFSLPHLIALGIFFTLAFFIVANRRRLATWRGEPRLRLVATTVAVAFELSLHVLQYLTQDWYSFLRGVIPLELCGISLWLAVALNASKSRGLWDLLYFWGLGAGASLIFANTDGANYDTFHFYQYFIVHSYILLTIVWFAAVHGYKVRFATLCKAVGVLFPITIALRFLDSAFALDPWKFNFMFLISPPDVPTPLDSFGHGWGYYFAFIALCTAVFALAWAPWAVAGWARRHLARVSPEEGRRADPPRFRPGYRADE
jgi:hypothetical integral membrane protein (TIGR02206 family)